MERLWGVCCLIAFQKASTPTSTGYKNAISPRLPVLVILIFKNLSILCATSNLYALSLILENLLFFWFLFPFAYIGYGWFFDIYCLNLFSMMGKFCNVVSLSSSLLLLWKLKVPSLSIMRTQVCIAGSTHRMPPIQSYPWGILLCDSCQKSEFLGSRGNQAGGI